MVGTSNDDGWGVDGTLRPWPKKGPWFTPGARPSGGGRWGRGQSDEYSLSLGVGWLSVMCGDQGSMGWPKVEVW